MRTLLVTLLAACAVASPADVAAAPRLTILDRNPLALKGTGFGGQERVTLAVTLGPKSDRRILRTTRAGTFLARFPGFVYDRCHGALTVTAVGARGHRTHFTLQPLPCPNSSDGATV
jgi:hypothetical protein